MSLLAVNASPSGASSKTRALAELAVGLAGGSILDVSSVDADALLLRRSHPSLDEALDRIAQADRVLLATPVYRATFSGILKVLLDQLPQDGLVGKACILAATAATPTHFLSLDTGLRAAVASIRGWSVPTVVFATSADFDDVVPGPSVVERLTAALAEADQLVRGVTGPDVPASAVAAHAVATAVAADGVVGADGARG